MTELSKKEENLINSMNLSEKAREEIKKVWRKQEYKYQREYINIFLLLMPMFILIFMATKGYPELNSIKYVWVGAACIIYFAIPTYIILRICFRTVTSDDRSILLGHSSMYLWRKPKLIKRIYTTVVSLVLILILAIDGVGITSICLTLSFIIIALCTIIMRKKIESVIDEIDQKIIVPVSIQSPEPETV